jgi:hypothetical protein
VDDRKLADSGDHDDRKLEVEAVHVSAEAAMKAAASPTAGTIRPHAIE